MTKINRAGSWNDDASLSRTVTDYVCNESNDIANDKVTDLSKVQLDTAGLFSISVQKRSQIWVVGAICHDITSDEVTGPQQGGQAVSLVAHTRPWGVYICHNARDTPT